MSMLAIVKSEKSTFLPIIPPLSLFAEGDSKTKETGEPRASKPDKRNSLLGDAVLFSITALFELSMAGFVEYFLCDLR